ncbi:hypothetical protein [Methanocella arvoryzae]|uniref:Uncharacterized protein n=1 Tax=Methanocella arvoryzae (strain DSM 22066 / NBRC 105507 / MRE50) TaxID=351160 RepID=Q0W6I4_METAR|nr:hypothetical protein [Methanocella arvoryzae]CAJ36009.1 hypothetical protein RCIX602 [Methanocella arvoryzae MRE50]
MFNSIYSPDNFSEDNVMPWYNVLLNSTISTTRYLNDNYANVEFKVIGQEEKDGHIYRISEFIIGNKIIVHSTVDIDIANNPPKFIDIMREEKTPIGDALRDNNYFVEREILHHDVSSKVYVMKGDVNLKITEKYYNM